MFPIDPELLETQASRLLLLVDAMRQRDHARAMLKRLHPMVQELKEALEPLQAEYNRWATKHYSAERRVAEVRKIILNPKSHTHKKGKRYEHVEMSDKQMQDYFAKQNSSAQAKLLAELEEMMKSGDE